MTDGDRKVPPNPGLSPEFQVKRRTKNWPKFRLKYC
jgi:hypothetical protein